MRDASALRESLAPARSRSAGRISCTAALRAWALAAWAAAGGCADGPDRAGAADALPFRTVADPQMLMLAVIEPAAEVYWDAVGVILDAAGEHRFEPGTEEEWEAVTHAAYVLAESGNLLLVGERAEQGGHWQAMSRAMIDVGERAVAAAESRDAEAVFAVGGDVYEVCTGCHAAYAAETLRPSYDGGGGRGPGDAGTRPPGGESR